MTFCSMSWTLAVYMKGLWIVVVFLHIGVKGTLELDHNGEHAATYRFGAQSLKL